MRQMGQLVGDLLRQFAGRREHNLLNIAVVQIDVFQHRDAESQRFTGSRRRNRNDIVPVHHKRNTLLLDGRQVLKTHPIKGLNNLPADPHLFKRMDCCCLCLVQDSILSLLIHSLVLLYLTAVDVASTSHHFRESYPLFRAFPRRLRGDFASGRESLVLHPPILRRFEKAPRGCPRWR